WGTGTPLPYGNCGVCRGGISPPAGYVKTGRETRPLRTVSNAIVCARRNDFRTHRRIWNPPLQTFNTGKAGGNPRLVNAYSKQFLKDPKAAKN
ncbi:MAG: hypothetical protein NC085_08920, partial [Muribaculaceae bacterium]|nr:hypothetical protein [Muribaculaceae bacterium]